MSLTRRQAVTATAGAAVMLPLVRAVPAGAAVSGDAAVLTAVAKVEQLLRYSYDLSAEGLADTPRLQQTLRAFAAHEAEHLGALATSLEALGAPKPVAPGTPEEADAAGAALGVEARFRAGLEPAEAVAYAHAAEAVGMRTLQRAAARLGDLNLLQTTLSILGCQAQHAAVLRAAEGQGPVPRPALIRS